MTNSKASNSVKYGTRQDAGMLILRVTLGVLVLFHGLSKISGGLGFVQSVLANSGLPTFLAPFVYIGEIVAPVLIIIGVFSRPAAIVIVINMLFAFGLAHMSAFFSLNVQGGWALELQGIYLMSSLAVALIGAGRYSVAGPYGKYN